LKQVLQKIFQINKLLLFIILIGLIHGSIYIFVAPPWGHYDEPTHFEYTWMIANRTLFPKAGNYDNALRRQILGSMVRNNFYALRDWDSNLSNLKDPVNIGVNQLGDPPVYYLLASIPLRFMRNQSIENQLTAGRFVSLILFLITVIVSWKFSHEIASQDNPVRWLIPLTLALMPALVELMTALSNDSAAVLVYSLFLWQGVRLIKYGPKLSTILILVVLTALGFFTKSSTWLMGIALVVALIVSFFKGKKILLGWGAIVIAAIFGLLVLFEWGDAALWYRASNQNEPTRVLAQIDGNQSYAIQLVDESTEHNPALYQTLLSQDLHTISGNQVTIGAWMWADRPTEAYLPRIMFINSKGQRWVEAKLVNITQQPTFYAYKVRLPIDISRAYIAIKPFKNIDQVGIINISNPVVVAGVYDPKTSPQFNDQTARQGNWAGKPFTNLVRNAGTINSWPKFRDYVYMIADAIDYRLAEGIGHVIYTLDFKGTSWYSTSTLSVIFRSFWAKFGWGEITLMGAKPYRPFYIAMVIMVVGCILGVKKKSSWSGLQIALWLGINIILSLGYAWFTGISMDSYIDRAYIPVARFIFPSILAILSFFTFGWSFWMTLIHSKYRWIGYAIYVVLFLALDVLSVMTVYAYYWE